MNATITNQFAPSGAITKIHRRGGPPIQVTPEASKTLFNAMNLFKVCGNFKDIDGQDWSVVIGDETCVLSCVGADTVSVKSADLFDSLLEVGL